jgi:hypothetical protein
MQARNWVTASRYVRDVEGLRFDARRYRSYERTMSS